MRAGLHTENGVKCRVTYGILSHDPSTASSSICSPKTGSQGSHTQPRHWKSHLKESKQPKKKIPKILRATVPVKQPCSAQPILPHSLANWPDLVTPMEGERGRHSEEVWLLFIWSQKRQTHVPSVMNFLLLVCDLFLPCSRSLMPSSHISCLLGPPSA